MRSAISTTVSFPINLNPAWFWVLGGASLCSAEFLLPKFIQKSFKFVPLTTGICALILADLLLRTPFSVLFKWQVF
ncbi:MAG: hypothetical protein ACKPH7_01825 [Planktothrix sp.]|uniref:hypothetical protein n=1 Tax=Planktothrix sp. TaxID=3088171 RepID=UPI0038D515B7